MDGLLGEQHVVTLGQTVSYEHEELLPLSLVDSSQPQNFPQLLDLICLEGLVVVPG